MSPIYLILVRDPLLCVLCSITLSAGDTRKVILTCLHFLGSFVRPINVAGTSMHLAATDY